MVIVTTILFTLAIIYFLPSILAITRKQKSIVDIILLNTFLGWTIIGWFAA
ncbi:superinfection immunity protein, partial [Candidatus Woesearchaeota archaeon]|nr:superinfection immunity protein [Candidatus Woesearchaeota archaeon]